MTVVAEGGCLCRRLRYAVLSEPIRTTVCHCRFCQRATGSAYHIAPVFLQDNFRVTAGRAKTYRHTSEGSGKALDIRFCPDCGCRIFLTLERFPGTVGVYGGTFDDPNRFAATSPVTKQIFLTSGRFGTLVPAGVDSFLEHAVTASGQAVEPIRFDQPKTLGSDDLDTGQSN